VANRFFSGFPYHIRMKRLFATLPRNLMDCFKGWKLVWHLVAILLTVILVKSGFDWHYFLATRSPELRSWMWPAVFIGGLLPIYLPLLLLAFGFLAKNTKTILTGWAVTQAELLGALIVVAYKAFTGRAHPTHNVGPDISQVFHFGFMRGGIFWGWPSSHTTVAFAMAVTLFLLYPKQRWLGLVATLYAFYIGVGVSMTIHWFSDFVAGAIVGSVIGTVVGWNFRETFNTQHSNSNVQGTPRRSER
jgi:membrane-associated phospholipid phosphatase